jgi:hypothetical protein
MGDLLDQGFAARKKSYDLLVAKVESGRALSATEISAMTRFEKELVGSGLDLPVYLDTIEEVEAYTGYKARTIYAAIKSGELPRLSDNRFLVEAVDAFLMKKGKRPQVRLADDDQGESAGDEPGPDGETQYKASNEEAKYRHFRAKREEIIVLRLKGELIERQAANRAFIDRIHEFRTSLLLLNRRVSHKIAEISGIESRLVDEILDAEAKSLLKTLSRKVIIHVD